MSHLYTSEKQLPLFAGTHTATPAVNVESRAVGSSARQYHERKSAQAEVLHRLRRGELLTDRTWKEYHPGSRLAPVVEKLRNAHGFKISGAGKEDSPYEMLDRTQFPSLIAVTDAMKEAYRNSQHWAETRERRFRRDSYTCVACLSSDDLQCHHLFYDLFNEHIRHLITLCESCHQIAHTQSKLAFPGGMKVEHASRLGFDVDFEEWLLPGSEANHENSY